MMLTPEQQAHFDVFGFLCLRQVFLFDEIIQIRQAADEVFAADYGGAGDDERSQVMAPFAELHPRLLDLAEDERVYGVVEHLLGSGFLWSGSEGKKEGLGGENAHHWHADRPGPDETEYLRLKVMIYLQSTTKEQGALRVIPGSHRMPFHELLWPLQIQHFKDGTIGDSFAVKGEEIPACVLEIAPGDVVFFHHSLFHAAYGKFPGRRYIAFKYATRPDTDAKLRSMHKYAPYAFNVDPVLLERPRLRKITEDLPALGEKARALCGGADPEGHRFQISNRP